MAAPDARPSAERWRGDAKGGIWAIGCGTVCGRGFVYDIIPGELQMRRR